MTAVIYPELILKSKLFDGIEEEKMKLFVQKATIKDHKVGDYIVKENEFGEEMFWIASGRIEIQIKAQIEKGSPVVLNNLKAGDIFGELMLFGIAPRTASAIVRDKSKLYVWNLKDCQAFFKEHPDMGYKITTNLGRMVGERLALMNKEIRDREKKLDIKLLQNLG